METLRDYVNWGLSHCDKTASAEGVPLILEKCVKNKKMKQFEVYGNSIQNGTPSPEAPVEVESVGEKCTKNLFDKDNAKNLFSNGHLSEPTATGIAIIPISSTGYGFFDLGPASNYVGKTINATMKVPRLGSETYTAFFAVCSANGNNRAEKGTHNIIVENGFAYITATYTVEDVGDKHLSLHLRVDGAKINNHYDFTEIMVYEGEEELPFEPYGKYKVPVVVKGKNIFEPTGVSAGGIRNDGTLMLKGSYGTTIDSTDFTDNKVVVTQVVNESYGSGSFQNGYICFLIPELVEGKKYTLSFDMNITNNPLNATSFLVYYSTSKYITLQLSLTSRYKFTFSYIPRTDRPQQIEARCGGMSFELSNVMITEEGQDETFEPYTEPITTNVYLNEPLRKVGNYTDVIDSKNKKLHRLIHEYYIDGSQTVTRYNDTVWLIYGDVRCKNIYAKSACSHFPNSEGLFVTFPAWNMANAFGNRIELRNANLIDGVTDGETLKQWFAKNPTTFIQPLETPVVEDISIELPKLNAKTSIIEIGTTVAPSNMKGKYIKR